MGLPTPHLTFMHMHSLSLRKTKYHPQLLNNTHMAQDGNGTSPYLPILLCLLSQAPDFSPVVLGTLDHPSNPSSRHLEGRTCSQLLSSHLLRPECWSASDLFSPRSHLLLPLTAQGVTSAQLAALTPMLPQPWSALGKLLGSPLCRKEGKITESL